MSDFDSSQSGSNLSPRSSPIIPSWWSDSDGRRPVHDGTFSGSESPWWESDRETSKRPEQSTTPSASPTPAVCGGDTSSSVTPPWWAEPSSHEIISSETEVDHQATNRHPYQQNECERRIEDEDPKPTSPSGPNCKKRPRERCQISSETSREPPVSKMKLEPPSPPTDPNSVFENVKRGVCHPLQSFLLFFTVDNLRRICDLTNGTGWEMVLENTSLANEDGTWKEVTLKELYVFIAIILIMRQNQDVLFGSFWQDNGGKNIHWPNTLMKRRRFFTLLQTLRIDEFIHESTEDVCLEISNCQTNDSNLHSGSLTLLRKRFKIFFDQLETVLQIFCRRCNIDSVEEIGRVEGVPTTFRNYIKILVQPYQGSAELKPNALIENQHVMKLNSVHTTTDLINHEPVCAEPEMKEHSETNNAGSIPLKDKCTSETKSDYKSRVRDFNHASPSETCNSLPKVETSSIHVIWENNTLLVTHDGCSFHNKPVTPSANEQNSAVFENGDWQDVFIPCPELVYKNLDAGRTKGDTMHRLDGTGALKTGALATGALATGAMFEKSYFYHYLHLAIHFAVSEDAKGRCVRSIHTSLDHSDPVNKIVDGLVLLSEFEPVSQSDSESETSGADMINDSSTSSEGSDADAGGKSRSHKYIQARSRVSHKCALCWSLHQEVRRVHTRCIRCERHFCVSRFRNCMAEAHRDKEIMKQLWDEDTSDKEGTSEKRETSDRVSGIQRTDANERTITF